MNLTKINLDEIIGKKVLIVGEVKRGKTRLTAKILDALVQKFEAKDITVIDMAPTTTKDIGASLSSYTNSVNKVKYLRPSFIRAPRLEGRTKEEVVALAEFNKNCIEPLIDHFLSNPTLVLIINDISIYLHRGDLSKIFQCMDKSSTFIANSYYGSFFNDKGSGISEVEIAKVEELARKADLIVRL